MGHLPAVRCSIAGTCPSLLWVRSESIDKDLSLEEHEEIEYQDPCCQISVYLEAKIMYKVEVPFMRFILISEAKAS